MNWLGRVFKEPLLHFLVLAAGLFMLSRFFSETPSGENPDTIVVSGQRIKSLILAFHRTWQRPPSQQELDGLVEDFIKEEVFYREALAMGLDRDDTLIRRRLRQKLEFVAEELADAVEPTEQQLQQFLDEHPDSFRVERHATFSHIYLSRDRRGDSLEADARQLLDKLRAADNEPFDPADQGDSFLLPHYHENLREGEISNLFGQDFGPQVLAVEAGQWSGPCASAYGLHLVLLHEKTAGRVPTLDEVRAAVRRDWYAARRAASKKDFFLGLRKRYEVVIEMPKVTDEALMTND
jgi:parvulin-like peptidyl-prolyl isomerase